MYELAYLSLLVDGKAVYTRLDLKSFSLRVLKVTEETDETAFSSVI